MTSTPESMIERVARILEPQAWAALGMCDTLAYKNRRTSSLRKTRAAIAALREPTPKMIDAMCVDGIKHTSAGTDTYPTALWRAAVDAILSEQERA